MMDQMLNSDSRPFNKSTGVGDNELFLHRQHIEWTAHFMDGKYFMADPHSINKLMQIQAEIELEKKLADEDEEENIRGQSFHSYRHKPEEVQQSFVTEADPERQRLNQFKVEQELEKEEDLYVKRITEARNKKKEEKKAAKNLVKLVPQQKDDFKSLKMDKVNPVSEADEDLKHSMVKKVTPLRQNARIKTYKQQQNRDKQQKEQVALNSQQRSEIKNDKALQILNKQHFGQENTLKVLPIPMNSIVKITIDEQKKNLSPKASPRDSRRSMLESQVVVIQTNPQNERSPSILSFKTESQHQKIQQKSIERAGDRFFYQLHSKIDQLQHNIQGIKDQIPSHKDQKVKPVPQKTQVQQKPSFKYQQSTVMINTKNLLKDLNKQLKEIGMIQPAEDSRITEQRNFNNISGIKVDLEQESKEKQHNILDALNTIKPVKVVKQLEVKNQVQIKIEPVGSKIQTQQQKQINELAKINKKRDNCKIISNLINQQVLQVAPNVEDDKNKQEKQKLNEQINILRQVINELRVERLKYQVSASNNERDHNESATAYSNFQRTERQPTNDHHQLSHQASPSIINKIAQSSVSEFDPNHYRTASEKAPSGRIIKNRSPFKKTIKVEERKNIFKPKEIKQEEINETEQRETSNNHSEFKEENRNNQLQNIKDSESVKMKTGSQEASNKEESRISKLSKNIDIVNVNNSESVGMASNTKSKLLFDKSIAPTVSNNPIKVQQDLQSSMPRPLNKHNNSQPPKFIIHQHQSIQKRHQSNFKKKIINNFEQLQNEMKNNYKTSTITNQPPVDPKKRATKEGAYKTVQSKGSYHPDLNKIVFNSGDTNLKAKIIEIEQQSQRQRAQLTRAGDRKNSFHNSQSSKGFRLRRGGSDSSRDSRVSSSKKAQKREEDKSSVSKQKNKNLYVPAIQSQNFVDHIKPVKQSQQSNQRQPESEAKQQETINFKVDKRKISFSSYQIPIFPNPPSPNIKIEQMSDLIKAIDQNVINLELRQQQLNRLIMKKYKNCIMIDLPNTQQSKLVWHYNGKIYIGQWNEADMVKTGEGIQYIPQKYFYKGQFLNGKRNGSGLMIQESGIVYEGQWSDGEKCGRGKYYDSSIKLNYQGQWKNGKKQGFGYFSIENQSIYQGTFVQNLKDGFGTQSFSNGDSYKGQYSKGRFHGKGKYVWSCGDSYDGMFYEGCKHGNGIWVSFIGQIYQGGYKNDKKNGSGKYKWGNGCIFEGEFQADKKNGNGVLKYPDGREVRGIWKDGKLIQAFDQPQKDGAEEPLSPKKSRIIEAIPQIKVQNKPNSSNIIQ